MAEPLKNMYNAAFFAQMTAAFQQVYAPFETEAFLEHLYNEAWDSLPLKARVRQIALCLRQFLPSEYREAIEVLKQAAPLLTQYSFEVIFFPEFVEVYGLDDWDVSLAALEIFTQYSSAEFAVRPFIMKDTPRMMAQMQTWARHPNHHVRRLASEGCRPRLPWAMALPMFKKDPAPILPILDALKDDESEYVRRSVANNLNDIAKDHPDTVIEALRRWSADTRPHVQWITHRALRTLVKAGHTQALDLLGFGNQASVEITKIMLSTDIVTVGQSLTFALDITSNSDQAQDLLIDYVVYFMKANGTQAPKAFKLTKKPLRPGETLHIEKTHSFKVITTRTYHPGAHALAFKINGQEIGGPVFQLLKDE